MTSTYLDNCSEFSYDYTSWLSKNFLEDVNTNHFSPEIEEDIIHEFDVYDHLIPMYYYEEVFSDEMFNTPPNLELTSDDEEEFVIDD